MADEPNKPDTAGASIALENADTGLQYLGDQAVVDGVLRQFAFDICERYIAVSAGEMLQASAALADATEVERLARVFLGEDAAYSPVVPWTGKPLADFCRARFKDLIAPGLLVSDESVLEQTLALFVHGLYDALRKLAADDRYDDATLAVDALVEDWTHLLLGLPASNEADNA